MLKSYPNHTLVCLPLHFTLSIQNIYYLIFSDSKADTSGVVEGRPAWMRTLHTSSSEWLALLPTSLNPLKRTVENIKDPLYRCEA